jgi:precorrin-6B methylase 2
LERADSGLVPVPVFAQAVTGRAAAFADGLRSTLGQAATAAFLHGDTGGWNRYADDILSAQGRASAMVGRVLATSVLPALDGLAQRFAQGGNFLDVGVGVAGLACAFCDAVPSARVVGLDPLARAIDLAAKTISDHGLTDRIELRCQGVEELEERQVFDLAFLPLPFIPARVVTEGLRRVTNALKPGGWLVLPGSVYEPDTSGEIARWQTHLAGGTLLTEAERVNLLQSAGYDTLTQVPVPPGSPPLFAARRPRTGPPPPAHIQQ